MDENKEALNMMYDMRERIMRIETQTERLNIIEERTNKAMGKAQRAETKANNNGNNIKTIWVFVSGLIIAIVSGYIKIIGGL